MKPEFKIKGREASPAEYAQLMEALLASQAATPTARACASDETGATPSLLDALFPENGTPDHHANDGERRVYPPISGFLEAGSIISNPSAAPTKAAPGRYE